MEYKYGVDIRNAILEVLLQSESHYTYSELYQKTKVKMGYQLSHRDYAHSLRIMEKEKLIVRDDETGKRGSKVYYYLTKTAKIQHQLRILKVEEGYEKKRSLYQILLYFQLFKRGELMSRRQLNRRLLKMGLRFDGLKTAENGIAKNLDRKSFELSTSKYLQIASFTNTSNDIAIIKYIMVRKSSSSANKNIVYYVFVPGFTREEFSTYIRKLRKLKDPRPFSKFPPLVPYVFYTDYTDDEIGWAIRSFSTAGLIRIMPSVFPGETRFSISDDWLLAPIMIIKLVQENYISNILAKISYINKPNEYDKQIMKLFFGERATNSIINEAYQIRKDFRNRSDYRLKIKRINERIQERNNSASLLMKELTERYGNELKSNELLTDLLVGFPIIQHT
jgi:hypothetical protein